jgi:virginiamycin B lyase
MSGLSWARALLRAQLTHARTGTLPMALRALAIAVVAAMLVPGSAAAQEFPIASPSFPDPNEVRCPGGITEGPDGALWFTEERTSRIGRMTTAGVVTHEFPVPITVPSDLPCSDLGFVPTLDQITTGPDGALWFTQPRDDQIGRITTAGNVEEFPLPSASFPAGSRPESITVGPDNALWFTAGGIGKIGRISSTPPHDITAFPSVGIAGSGLSDITRGSDGALWFTESNPIANSIGRITTNGDITHHYAVPTPGAEPSGITLGPAGSLWFTESSAGQIGQITTGGTITEYPGASAGPSAIAVGRDGALWFTESEASSIGRITTSGAITNHFPTSTPASEPSDIISGPDGAVWFSEFAGNKIGRIATTPPVTTLPQLPPIKPLLPATPCRVPKVVGLSVKKAKQKLRRAGCKFRVSGTGFVVSTSPRAGRRTTKTVQVKARLTRCTVPKVAGLSVKKAKKKLRRARCRFRVKGSGQVVSTSPRAGKRTTKTVQVKASQRPPR